MFSSILGYVELLGSVDINAAFGPSSTQTVGIEVAECRGGRGGWGFASLLGPFRHSGFLQIQVDLLFLNANRSSPFSEPTSHQEPLAHEQVDALSADVQLLGDLSDREKQSSVLSVFHKFIEVGPGDAYRASGDANSIMRDFPCSYPSTDRLLGNLKHSCHFSDCEELPVHDSRTHHKRSRFAAASMPDIQVSFGVWLVPFFGCGECQTRWLLAYSCVPIRLKSRSTR